MPNKKNITINKLKEEAWIPVFEANGWYEVSDLGHIRRTQKGQRTRIGRILAPYEEPRGYLIVTLSCDNKKKQHLVHRLVATAFLGACPDGKEVNHKNGIKNDNRIENLEYITP